MLTHGNVSSNVLQAEAWIADRFTRGAGVLITAIPLYHVFALTGELPALRPSRLEERTHHQCARFSWRW